VFSSNVLCNFRLGRSLALPKPRIAPIIMDIARLEHVLLTERL
jgi:hypothetical protein